MERKKRKEQEKEEEKKEKEEQHTRNNTKEKKRSITHSTYAHHFTFSMTQRIFQWFFFFHSNRFVSSGGRATSNHKDKQKLSPRAGVDFIFLWQI
jgi:hypothetical protein